MKKVICILFAVIVVILSSTCLAEEIQFRDFEWGISVDGLEREMENYGYMAYSTEVYMPLWGSGEYLLRHYMVNETTSEITGWVCVAADLGSPISVAGYNAQMMNLYCAYDIDDDGMVAKSKQASKFYQAKYKLTVADAGGAYADLKDKLSRLYGECTELYKETHDAEAVEIISEWKGANNTAVRLCGKIRNPETKTSDAFEHIEIYYGKCDEDAHLGIVEDMIIQEKKVAESALYGNSDISGL